MTGRGVTAGSAATQKEGQNGTEHEMFNPFAHSFLCFIETCQRIEGFSQWEAILLRPRGMASAQFGQFGGGQDGAHSRDVGNLISGQRPVPFGNSSGESQRDSAPKPRVARNELPWVSRPESA